MPSYTGVIQTFENGPVFLAHPVHVLIWVTYV